MKTPLFTRHQPGGMYGIINEEVFPGNVFWVNSSTGVDSAGYGQDPDSPVASIDYAVGLCTANNGDAILIQPGYTGSITSAGAVAADVEGVKIIGLGVGNDRPKLTFSGSTAASMTVSANSVKIKNIICIAGIDGLINPFNVTGDDCDIDIEWRDTSAAVEAARSVLLNGADRSKVNIKYNGFTAGNAVENAVRLIGCSDVSINIIAYGVVSTAWVEFLTTASTNVKINAPFLYTQAVTNLSRNVVDTVGGSTWSTQGFDASAGQSFSGGSGAALAGDDVSSIASAIATIQAELSGAAGLTSFPAGAVAANGVSLAEVIRYVMEATGSNDSNNTFSSSSVAANVDGSVLERLEDLNNRLPQLLSRATGSMASGYNTGSVVQYTVTGDVLCRAWGVVTTNLTSTSSTGTISLGTTDGVNVLIPAATANGTALQAGDVWADTTSGTNIAGLPDDGSWVAIGGGADIALTVATNNITAGGITTYLQWMPISAGATIVAA